MTPKLHAKKVMDMLPKEGMTMLAFLGRGTNSRPFYGASGRRYLFGGKHHTIGNVLDSDVEYMLKIPENGKPLFEVVKVATIPAGTYPSHAVEPVIEQTPVEEAAPTPKRRTRRKKVEQDA